MFLREGLFLFLYANAEAQQSAKHSFAAKRSRWREKNSRGVFYLAPDVCALL